MPKPTVLLVGLEALADRLSAQNLALYDYGVMSVCDSDAALVALQSNHRIGALVVDVDLAGGEIDGLEVARAGRGLDPRLHVIYVARRPQMLPERRKVARAPTLRSPFFPHQLTGVLSELRSERTERALAAEAA